MAQLRKGVHPARRLATAAVLVRARPRNSLFPCLISRLDGEPFRIVNTNNLKQDVGTVLPDEVKDSFAGLRQSVLILLNQFRTAFVEKCVLVAST
jgi:hypothetical protein